MKLVVALAVIVALWWLGRRRKAGGRPSVSDARALLGVSAQADEMEIRAAHRRLIGRVHPDAGGSAALAIRVNEARDILVSELNRKSG